MQIGECRKKFSLQVMWSFYRVGKSQVHICWTLWDHSRWGIGLGVSSVSLVKAGLLGVRKG